MTDERPKRDWQRIREQRHDLTDWLIHFTRGRTIKEKWKSPLVILKRILDGGYLLPGRGYRASQTMTRGAQPTIDRKAVCFTEQPLNAFVHSCSVLPGRYERYGIAVQRQPLFRYGGRPVIYSNDTRIRDALPPSLRHFWARFDPVPDDNYEGYPLDWTHEREWRVVPHEVPYPYETDRGERSTCWSPRSDVVPIVLPGIDEWFALPVVVVPSVRDAQRLKRWLKEPPKLRKHKDLLVFSRVYAQVREQIRVVPLDVVEKRIEAGEEAWRKLETLPFDELESVLSDEGEAE